MPCLRIKLPNQEGEMTHLLAGERITIGRRADNTIQIIDGTVSAHHAELIAVNGHYRLHDLGSTNLTCVEGTPVRDFHLHSACKLLFGSIEAEFSPESQKSSRDEKAEMVPTRAEMEFLRRENFELQSKVSALQKQVDILGSARLMTKGTTKLGVLPETHRKVVVERDQLLEQTAGLRLDVENSRCDILAIMRDRDAMRQAWETVKAELAELRQSIPATPMPSAPPAISPALIEKLRASLGQLAAEPASFAARDGTLGLVENLATSAGAITGHPLERLASAMNLYFRDLAQRAGAIDSAALQPMLETLDVFPALLDPRLCERAKDWQPHILALDGDADLLATLVASLEMADLAITGCKNAAAALAELRGRAFDLILLDAAISDAHGLDVCTAIRTLPGYRQTPIVFLTSSDTTESRTRSIVSSGHAFLAKPFNILELTLRAETWIYRHQFALT